MFFSKWNCNLFWGVCMLVFRWNFYYFSFFNKQTSLCAVLLEYPSVTCLLQRLWWHLCGKYDTLRQLNLWPDCQFPSHWLPFWRLVYISSPWETSAVCVKCLQNKDCMIICGNNWHQKRVIWFIAHYLALGTLQVLLSLLWAGKDLCVFLHFLPLYTNSKSSGGNHRPPGHWDQIPPERAKDLIRSTWTWRKNTLQMWTWQTH